ncbi:MAG: V-type ATP synthase subunit E family protein [Sphaerochaetaceae bacterium]
MSEQQTDHLFEGILKSAKAEAAKILASCEVEGKGILGIYEKRLSAATEIEKRQTKIKVEQINRNVESTIRNLQRRHSVSYTQRLRELVLELVAQKMEKLREEDSYRQVLINWIGEAAIALDKEEAVVDYCFKETIDTQMLISAQELIKQATGRSVKLKLGKNRLTSQGVEVVSTDGRVAYNNQVATRLIRLDRQLKELMEGQTCQEE